MSQSDPESTHQPTWVPAEEPACEPAAAAHPRGVLWLYYLYFRPRVFFTWFVLDPSPGLTALCAWLYGMAGVIDELESRAVRDATRHLPESWPLYWSVVALGGILAGLLHFSFGGWWYRQRLRWSGADQPDRYLARRVYLYASQVVALPTLLATVAETSTFPTPADALAGESAWYAVLLVFPLWSLWTSYVGVRTAFTVRSGRAVFWFVILPGVFYALLYGSVLASAFLAAAPAPADLEQPRVHDSATMAFSYPGSWSLDTADEDHDPGAYVLVEAPQAAFVQILLYPATGELGEELDASRDALRESMSDVTEAPGPDRWAHWSGQGVTLQGSISGVPWVTRVFVTALGDGRFLEVCESCAADDEAVAAPGFELIRGSFELKP